MEKKQILKDYFDRNRKCFLQLGKTEVCTGVKPKKHSTTLKPSIKLWTLVFVLKYFAYYAPTGTPIRDGQGSTFTLKQGIF